MARVTASDIKQAVGGGVGVWRDDLASALDGVVTVESPAELADLDQTISDPPTQTEVQAISDKIDTLLAALRSAGIITDE